MMMSSAAVVHDRLGGPVPSHGTGPLAGGGRKRWITARDVFAFHFFSEAGVAARARESSWDAATSSFAKRELMPSHTALRDYQIKAVQAANPTGRVFTSGEIEIGCGLGKTFVGGELIRRSRAPAVVITQHQLSVHQWMHHLINIVRLPHVATSGDAWGVRDSLPDVVVTTYQAIVRVSTDMKMQKQGIDNGASVKETDAHRLVWALHCFRFGLLILDEVHMGVADQFQLASSLNASAVYGLSGSMIREDDRLLRMRLLVGPSLFFHHAPRVLSYEIIEHPVSEEVRALMMSCHSSILLERAVRALTPAKMCSLQALFRKHRGKKMIVFCDSRLAAVILHRHVQGAHLLHGGIVEEERRRIVESFSCVNDEAILVSTRVCDAAVDFPSGCIIIQLFSSCGSRQQEVQRAGRGSRGDDRSGSVVVHLVNRDTEEMGFVTRRVEHMQSVFHVELTTTEYDPRWVDEATLQGEAPIIDLRRNSIECRKRARSVSECGDD